MISSFKSPYSFSTLFIKTSLSWVIFESIKALEIKTFMLFILVFANNTILSCIFPCSCFLIIDFYFLIPAVNAQIFNPFAELVIPIGIPSKKAKAEVEKYPVNTEAKIRQN